MVWSVSFSLMPDEEIVDDSTTKKYSGVKPAYSVFLTNKRAIFRFDGLGSSLAQSFSYNEILNARFCTRLFINYIEVRTEKKEYLLNVPDPGYWAEKILRLKETFKEPFDRTPAIPFSSPEGKKRELLDMLMVLRKNSLLTEKELDEKVRLLSSMKM